MKKLIYGIISVLLMIGSFLLGFLIRQPKINKLKKQVELLQKDNSRLIAIAKKQQKEFQELLVQHKALKALQFRKKSASKEQLTENLVMQYAIREYLNLLLKSVKYEHKLEKEEILFFNAFEKFIDGKKLSASDKVKIRDHIMEHYGFEVKQLKECEYASVMEELCYDHEPPTLLICGVQIAKKKKSQHYVTEDTTVMVGDLVYIPAGKSEMVVAEVVEVMQYNEGDAPVNARKAPRIIRKCHEEELLLPTEKR